MTRTVIAAAVQLDAAPAPVPDRLFRAAQQIEQAAAAGAQLVVLPEVFNTGYVYDDANYALAEPLNGQTITWMKDQAAARQVYVAGSLLLLDGDELFHQRCIYSGGDDPAVPERGTPPLRQTHGPGQRGYASVAWPDRGRLIAGGAAGVVVSDARLRRCCLAVAAPRWARLHLWTKPRSRFAMNGLRLHSELRAWR